MTTIGVIDTVAYLKLGRAVKGSEAFTFRWRDMTWQFSSQEHRDLFAADPERYAAVRRLLRLGPDRVAAGDHGP